MPSDRGTQSIEVPDYQGLLSRYEALQRERDDLHQNLVAARTGLADMDRDRGKYKARIRVLEEESKELQQELGCWESATGCGSHDKGADLIAALRRERTQLDNQLASARKERAQFFADASRNATEREEQRARAEKAEQEAVELRADTGRLVEENEMLVQGVEKAERERDEARSWANEQEAQRIKALDYAGDLRKDLNAAQAELARFQRADVPELVAAIEKTFGKFGEVQALCDIVRQQAAEIERLKAARTAIRERIQSMAGYSYRDYSGLLLRSEVLSALEPAEQPLEKVEELASDADDMGNQIALVRDWWYRRSRAWKRSARGFRMKTKILKSALLLAHKERDEVRAKLAAFGQADTQPQIAGFLVANGEAVRFENGNVLPADPQTQIAHLRLEIAQHLAAAQGDREMRKELGDIMGCVSPKNPDKIPSWPLLHNTARGLQRLADQAGEGNSHLWKMVAAAVGDEWKKYHTAGTSMASALCATITGIRQRLAAYEQPFNNLTLLEIEERRAEDADCKALINAIRIERGNVDALKETLQRIARILNFGTAGKADSLVECVGRVHAAWLQARKDLAEHRSNVDTWAYAQLIGRKNAEKRAARAEQKAAAVALRLAEATERCQRDAARLGAVLHWANETDNAIVRGLALGQLP